MNPESAFKLIFRPAGQNGMLARPQGAWRLRRTLAVRRKEARDRERQQMAFSPPPVDAGRLLKTASHEAAGKPKPEAYPQGYVEDFGKPRTTWEVVFSSLLHRARNGLVCRSHRMVEVLLDIILQ